MQNKNKRAYGAHRRVSQEQKARDIAVSTMLRDDEGRAWDWSTYGLQDNSTMQALVLWHRNQLLLQPM